MYASTVRRVAALEARHLHDRGYRMILRTIIDPEGTAEYLGMHAAPPWLPEAVDRAEGESWDAFVERLEAMLPDIPGRIPSLLARDNRTR